MRPKHYGYLYQGKKVGLRALSKADLEGDYLFWFNDPQVLQYSSHHIYPNNTFEQFEQYILHSHSERTRLVWAIDALESEQHIGNICLQSIDYINRHAEFAILIGNKSYWHQGYAREASVFALKHGFQTLNLHRIYCGTTSNNLGMQKLAERLHMKKEGELRDGLYIHGQYVNTLLYGILKSDFLTLEKEIDFHRTKQHSLI